MMEPLTSLLIREFVISAAAAGKLSRSLDQVARVLRKHLQPEVDWATMALNKGESGTEKERAQSELPFLPGPSEDPFGPDLQKDAD